MKKYIAITINDFFILLIAMISTAFAWSCFLLFTTSKQKQIPRKTSPNNIKRKKIENETTNQRQKIYFSNNQLNK
tara:strand:+ start:649 stop:873 length:225 start_codon:yes stop_codon:yes gene_type:complete